MAKNNFSSGPTTASTSSDNSKSTLLQATKEKALKNIVNVRIRRIILN
jgi:hypothetical protein